MSVLNSPPLSDTSTNLEQLRQAVKNWDTASIAELLKNGADCTGTNEAGKTILYIALKNNPDDDSEISKVIETIKLLHSAGVDLNAKDKVGKTVLHVAFKSKLMEVVKSLIELGANINEPDFHHNTIAHYLIESLSNYISEPSDDWKGTYIINWLLSKGMNVDYMNNNQKTPLHLAAKLNCPVVLLAFVKHSKDINCPDNEGKTVFHLLMKHNDDRPETVEVCKQLLLQGCSVNVADILGNTPVHIAAKEKKISMLKLMLDSFTNVKIENDFGENALSALLNVCSDETVQQEEGLVDMVSSLIEKGTNIYASKEDFLSSVQLAAECKHAEIFKTVVAREANLGELCNDSRLLHHLCMGANNPSKDAEYAEMIDLLVNKGGDVNNKNIDGKTPLHLASQSAITAVVQKLIETGANVYCREPIGWWTPLHLAVKSHRFAAITPLVDAKVDIDAKDSKGKTPLHLAALSCKSKMTGMLLELGADVDARDKKHRSPLYCAVKSHNLTAIEDLLKYGADVCDPAVFNRVVRLERNEKVLACLTEHWYKLKIAKMTAVMYYEEYEDNLNFDFRNQCAREMKTLKKSSIDNSTTFYEFLQLNRNERCAYTNDDNFRELVESSDLANKFPKYHVLILALYHQAVKRKSLLKLACRNWYAFTKVRLPDVCLYNIFNHLTNEHLKSLTEINAGMIDGLKRCVEESKFFPLVKEIKRRRR